MLMKTTRFALTLIAALLVVARGVHADDKPGAAPVAPSRPNILWITIEDWSPDLSCYGTKGISTPNVDKLASEGIRYERAFVTAPVCSASRSAMMTGFYQNYIGASQHREPNKKPLPYGIKPIPHLMAEAGYFTVLMSQKVDVNFLPDTRKELFQGTDWKQRKPGQPFFARITFTETHRPWVRDPERPVDPQAIEVPPQYPDTDFVRHDRANGYEAMQVVDRKIGALLKRLQDEGLADNTLVFFISDHGVCEIRGKQFLYDEGTRIPMIMRWPGHVKPGQVNTNLVSTLDLCATVLEVAGAKSPVPVQGMSLFSPEIQSRKYIFTARDKMDQTHDAMRAIRSQDYKLILNLMPERAWCQFSHYKETSYPLLAEMNVLNLQGKLTPEQAAFFAPTKPEIELFNLNNDPHELHNLASDPAYAKVKAELLAELDLWRKNVIKDTGVSKDFRAVGVFPDAPPNVNVENWVAANEAKYDFEKSGYPGWYPTRTLAEWQQVRTNWEAWVFRAPDSKMAVPTVTSLENKAAKPKH